MRRVMTTSPLLVLIILFTTFFSFSLAGDTLTPAWPLADGETLVSAGGNFVLGFFSPSGSKNRYVGIWYNHVSLRTIVWVANRQNPVTDSDGTLEIKPDGSLIISGHNSSIIWSSPATNNNNVVAQLLDNGNFVVREADTSVEDDGFAWQSFDYPTDALLPGMKLGWNLTSGLNRNLTSWLSPSDPSPGQYCLTIDTNGDPQVFLREGANMLWRSGPWDGLRFSGIPMMKTYSAFKFTFVNNQEEIYYMYHIFDTSIITRLFVPSDATVKRLVWLNETNQWNVFWSAPDDQCDDVSPCGQFGVCNANDSPICDCLQGFVPKSPKNWGLRDGHDGCVRETPLDCRNGTDGFVTVSEAKLPDTSTATVNTSMSLGECRAACLSNCSCTAYAAASISNGTNSGCIIWTSSLTDLRVYAFGGQDLYVRLAAADLDPVSSQSQKRTEVTIAIVVGITSGATVLTLIGCCIWRRKKRRPGTISLSSHYKDGSAGTEDLELPLFDFDTIVAATNSFSVYNKLGEGGFGPVYKGKLEEEHDIAVKRLAKTSLQGLDEFKNEVMLIAKLQHRNLVQLLGCCIQGDERLLIYEFMPNKSLDTFLFDKSNDTVLNWQTRYHIIGGIARGLLYLHQDSRYRIIHRDLKAGNILLDKDMNPKISDFGMARIFGGDETQVNTRKVVGTFGYMSPEYAMDGIFSVKSDVFSFGVLVLEIISGKRNRGVYLSEEHQNLLCHAWSLWKEGNCLGLVDDSLCSFPMTEVLRCINIALLCLQESPEDRPTMSSIVLMLGSDNISLPDPKQPGFFLSKGSLQLDLSLSINKSYTVNDITITMSGER